MLADEVGEDDDGNKKAAAAAAAVVTVQDYGPSTASTAVSVSLHFPIMSSCSFIRFHVISSFPEIYKSLPNELYTLTLLQDFPEESFKPKVQLPFFTPPGQCPRKIEIER